MIEVTLNDYEWRYAASVGMERHMDSVRKNDNPYSYGFNPEKEDAWGKDIEGACGECAAAKALNIHWVPTVGTYKSGSDVGGYQVRTRSNHGWDLLVRPDDKASLYILVTGKGPTYRVWGYFNVSDSKFEMQDSWWDDKGNGRPPAWFIPKKYLKPIEQLKRKA